MKAEQVADMLTFALRATILVIIAAVIFDSIYAYIDAIDADVARLWKRVEAVERAGNE